MECKCLCQHWDKQGTPFNSVAGDLKTDNNFTFATKVKLNQGLTTIGTIYALSYPSQDEEKQGLIVPSSGFTVDHKINSKVNLSFSNMPKETTTKFMIDLLSNNRHKLKFIPLFKLQKNEDSTPIANFAFNYNLSNNVAMQLGLNNCSKESNYLPGLYDFNIVHGQELKSGKNLNLGANMKYYAGKKLMQNLAFLCDIKNNSLNTLLILNLDRKLTKENENPVPPYQKSVTVKMMDHYSDKITFGGESTFRLEKKSLESKFFSRYHVDKETMIKGVWEDKDKSLTLGLMHKFRGLLKACVNYKIKPNDSLKAHNGFNALKGKIGFNIEVDESLF